MNHPLLGDPASISALAAALRRTSLTLRADTQHLDAALADAAPGWAGPGAARVRSRVHDLVSATEAVAAALDGCSHALQVAAADLATSLAELRRIEEEAAGAGLAVRDGTVERSWGITGLADAGTESDGDRLRRRLQERVHRTVTTMGRHRTRLVSECERSSRLLAGAAAALRS